MTSEEIEEKSFPGANFTYEQQAMMSISMQMEPTIQLAAQAALECVAEFEPEVEPEYFMNTCNSFDTLPEIPQEEEDDLLVTTYKGRYQCPRPNCSKVSLLDLSKSKIDLTIVI